VNCMDLPQRSPTGLLRRILQDCGSAHRAAGTIHGLLGMVVEALAHLGGPVVLIVDEVDQLIRRGSGRAGSGRDSASGFDALLSLPSMPGAPHLAFIAIANAVDLLARGAATPTQASQGCASLLFEPYTAAQLKSIVRSRLAKSSDGASAERALGAVRLELQTRQVAKFSGDCRGVLSLCEEAQSDSSNAKVGAFVPGSSPMAMPSNKQVQAGPLKAVQQLPQEQLVLLCALAHADHETMRVSDVCARYKDFCKRLHQPVSLASKGHVLGALEVLEQRSLLEFRKAKGPRSSGAEKVVELAVSREAVRESIVRANPLLERCLA